MAHMDVRGSLCWAGSFLPPLLGTWDLNSGLEASTVSVPLAEPSHFRHIKKKSIDNPSVFTPIPWTPRSKKPLPACPLLDTPIFTSVFFQAVKVHLCQLPFISARCFSWYRTLLGIFLLVLYRFWCIVFSLAFITSEESAVRVIFVSFSTTCCIFFPTELKEFSFYPWWELPDYSMTWFLLKN